MMSRILRPAVLLCVLLPALAGASEVDLGWSPSVCAPNASCWPVTSYQVVRCTGVGCTPTPSQPVASCLLPATACVVTNAVPCTCADTTAVAPHTYRYAVYGVGGAGQQTGLSNVVDATLTLIVAPTTPGSMTVISIKP